MALQDYAHRNGLPLYVVEQRFTRVHHGTRAEAMARSRQTRHPDSAELGALARARRRAMLLDES